MRAARGPVLVPAVVVFTAFVAAPGSAHAERVPIITLGGTIDFRYSSPSWDDAANQQTPTVLGGTQVTLAFEDRPLPLTPVGKVAGEARLVPELIAGFLSGDRFAEGYLGAGVRAELHMAGPKARAGFYIAGRGLVIGANRDAAGEFVIGDYIMLPRMARIGVEGGAMVRPQDRDGNHELDAVMRLFVGWRI